MFPHELVENEIYEKPFNIDNGFDSHISSQRSGPNNEAAISGGYNFLNVRQMLRLPPPPLERSPRRNDLAIQ